MVKDIYLAKIYFSDMSQYKIRPILVIKDFEEDVICLQLTSQFKKGRILITNYDLTEGKLKKDSLVVVPKNFTIHKSVLGKKLGIITNDKFNEIFNLFCEKIGCKGKK